jgi:hypothetical protein
MHSLKNFLKWSNLVIKFSIVIRILTLQMNQVQMSAVIKNVFQTLGRVKILKPKAQLPILTSHMLAVSLT